MAEEFFLKIKHVSFQNTPFFSFSENFPSTGVIRGVSYFDFLMPTINNVNEIILKIVPPIF